MNKKQKQMSFNFNKTIQGNAEAQREVNKDKLERRVMTDMMNFNPRNFTNKAKGKNNGRISTK